MAEPFPLEPSLWAATASDAPPTPPLEGSAGADVVIIGAGYAGLSTALHLAERGVSLAFAGTTPSCLCRAKVISQ